MWLILQNTMPAIFTPSQNNRATGDTWRAQFSNRSSLLEVFLTLLLLLVTIRVCALVMNVIELRKGVSLPDPVLSSFEPMNLRWPIFVVLWGALLGSIYHLSHYPKFLIMSLQAGGLLLVFRTIALALVPLEPMTSIIPLNDPIVVGLGTGKTVVKDLFFSGHTAMIFLCALAARSSRWRILCLASTLAVGLGVILQHVHYSGDVYAAPFFAYASWRIVLTAHERFQPGRPMAETAP